MIKKHTAIACACAFALLIPCAAATQARADYPDHAITAIIPFEPGGNADIFARFVAPPLGKILGQTVVVVNKGGAAGNLGIQLLAQSKPDGYTILFNGAASVINPALFRHLSYDPIKDIDAVADLAESPYVIAVNSDKVPAQTLRDFVSLIKTNPGKFNAGAGGSGQRVPVALFLQQNDLQAQIVPYTGSGPVMTALLSGEIDFTVVTTGPLAPIASSGKIRMLATAGEARSPRFPDIPTSAEAGLPEYHVADSITVYVRRGIPPAIADKLNAALNAVVAQPDIASKIRALDYTIVSRSAPAASDNYRHQVELWKDVVARAHIPPLD